MLKRLRKPPPEHTFAVLFQTFKNRVFGFVLTITNSHYAAEEITQEVFLKLWLYRDNLENIEFPENYLFTIARNKTLNYLRKASHDGLLIERIKNTMTSGSNNVDEAIAAADCEKLVHSAMEMLPPQSLKIYKLSRYEGLTHKQIAEHLGLSPNTIKNQLVTALRVIRDYLRKHGVTLIFMFIFFW